MLPISPGAAVGTTFVLAAPNNQCTSDVLIQTEAGCRESMEQLGGTAFSTNSYHDVMPGCSCITGNNRWVWNTHANPTPLSNIGRQGVCRQPACRKLQADPTACAGQNGNGSAAPCEPYTVTACPPGAELTIGNPEVDSTCTPCGVSISINYTEIISVDALYPIQFWNAKCLK